MIIQGVENEIEVVQQTLKQLPSELNELERSLEAEKENVIKAQRGAQSSLHHSRHEWLACLLARSLDALIAERERGRERETCMNIHTFLDTHGLGSIQEVWCPVHVRRMRTSALQPQSIRTKLKSSPWHNAELENMEHSRQHKSAVLGSGTELFEKYLGLRLLPHSFPSLPLARMCSACSQPHTALLHPSPDDDLVTLGVTRFSWFSEDFCLSTPKSTKTLHSSALRVPVDGPLPSPNPCNSISTKHLNPSPSCSFERQVKGALVVKMVNLDPSNPKRLFSFTIGLEESEQYTGRPEPP